MREIWNRYGYSVEARTVGVSMTKSGVSVDANPGERVSIEEVQLGAGKLSSFGRRLAGGRSRQRKVVAQGR